MAFHNTNYEAVVMPVGTYNVDVLGNGLSASTVHEVFCTTGGAVTITARGGGKFSWTATAGQTVKVMPSQVIVASGEFVGFRTNHQGNYRNQVGL
jgi:hypothetical protein